MTDWIFIRPVLVTYDDRYCPVPAHYVIQALQSLSDEDVAVTLTLAIDAAWLALNPTRARTAANLN